MKEGRKEFGAFASRESRALSALGFSLAATLIVTCDRPEDLTDSGESTSGQQHQVVKKDVAPIDTESSINLVELAKHNPERALQILDSMLASGKTPKDLAAAAKELINSLDSAVDKEAALSHLSGNDFELYFGLVLRSYLRESDFNGALRFANELPNASWAQIRAFRILGAALDSPDSVQLTLLLQAARLPELESSLGEGLAKYASNLIESGQLGDVQSLWNRISGHPGVQVEMASEITQVWMTQSPDDFLELIAAQGSEGDEMRVEMIRSVIEHDTDLSYEAGVHLLELGSSEGAVSLDLADLMVNTLLETPSKIITAAQIAAYRPVFEQTAEPIKACARQVGLRNSEANVLEVMGHLPIYAHRVFLESAAKVMQDRNLEVESIKSALLELEHE